MGYFYISAAHKSSGKTTLSIGLCAAIAARGHVIQPFKKGPDYIDPLWLSKASGNPCYNLDFNTQSHDEIQSLFSKRLAKNRPPGVSHKPLGQAHCIYRGQTAGSGGLDRGIAVPAVSFRIPFLIIFPMVNSSWK